MNRPIARTDPTARERTKGNPMADTQAPEKPIAIQFAGVSPDAVETLARTIAAALDKEFAGVDNEHVRNAVEKLRATLASPRSRRSLRFLSIGFSDLAFACRYFAPDLAPIEALDRVDEAVGEQNLADYRADVDSGHVTRALRILAVRAPAAYDAVRAALEADPGVEVTTR